MKDLDEALKAVARVPVLLIASDFDGTLAPIVDDPKQAVPHRESIVALRGLAKLPSTSAAIITGRSLRDVTALAELPADVHVVGSHGSEFDLDFAKSLPARVHELRARVRRDLEAIRANFPGSLVEDKPASFAFHYRRLGEQEAKSALEAVQHGPAAYEGVHVRQGKQVIELLLIETDKGLALQKVRAMLGATAVVFLGDDRTDEDAFATLRGPDVSIKVGPGQSLATYRIADPLDVAFVLARLHELRSLWFTDEAAVPIVSHSMLSDHRTAALITPIGRVTWFCVPRLDSPALFAELLGGPTAGFFAIEALDGSLPVKQRYLESSMVLETIWRDFRVLDFLDCSHGLHERRAGRTDLVRIIEGTGRIHIEFAPRLDFGRAKISIRREPAGLTLDGWVEPVALRAPGVEWMIERDGDHPTAMAEVNLRDSRLVLDLRYGTRSLHDTELSGPERLRRTDDHWRLWARSLRRAKLDSDLVERSALVLKALTHTPTGAIAAAATTSLPENVGGVRNWDYRFCWPRDAAMAAVTLVDMGSIGEAMAFLDWMLHVLDECVSPSRLQPIYGLRGETLPPEAEISELPGYRGSRPVRISNSAAQQVQLDVFAPIVELVLRLLKRGAPISSEHWRLVDAMVHAVAERWHEPDHGIWEERIAPRHHVHSKVLCWATVDRALEISRSFLPGEPAEWLDLRDEIRADVLANAWSPTLGAFRASYGRDELDAATLSIGLSGLLHPRDERFVATVRAVEDNLRHGATVYRYRFDDGLPGTEGGFHLCTGWLVQAYVAVGRLQDAHELYRAFASLPGPTGLYSEQYDPKTGDSLGNVPQAYSHIALIQCALLLGG
ncbi:MAG: trehalose-phosphatase [Planctomycetota bacterium]